MIIETQDGYNVVVNGRTFGTWSSRAEARAGMAVETARAAKQKRFAKIRWDERTP